MYMSPDGNIIINESQLLQVKLFKQFFVVFANLAHIAEGRARRAKNRAAKGQDAGELAALHLLIVARDETPIAVVDADNLRVKQFIRCAGHAADCRIQAGAVTAAGQNTDSSFHCQT